MDAARDLAQAGAPHGTAITARAQTAGRGRNGHSWSSPPGNLYATLVLRPGAVQHAPALGFVTAVAVADAVDDAAGPGTALKWPNDVLRGGAKLAGILLEALEDGAVLAGIGVNVGYAPAGMPYPVTSLAALGSFWTPDALLDAILRHLTATWDLWRAHGLDPVLDRWRARGPAPGTALRVRLGAEIVHGSFAGLAATGALLLQTPQGTRTVLAGEVLFPAA